MPNQGAALRRAAVEAVNRLFDDPATVVAPQTRDLLRAALRLYADRPDKEWSGIDCMSMIVMDERDITDVLTRDHTWQAGKRIFR